MTKQVAGRYYSRYSPQFRQRYQKRHKTDEEPEGFPCYDKEFNVIQASVGIAALMYVFFHKNKSIPQADEGMVRVEIEGADSIEEGHMKEIKVGEGKQDKVLVSRYRGELYAVGAYCSHFGFPLS